MNGVEGSTGPGNRQTGAPSPGVEAGKPDEATGRHRHRATDVAPRGNGPGQPGDRASTPVTEAGRPADVVGAAAVPGNRGGSRTASGPGNRVTGRKRASPAETLRGSRRAMCLVETQANARRSASGGPLHLRWPRAGAPAQAGCTARGYFVFDPYGERRRAGGRWRCRTPTWAPAADPTGGRELLP